MKKIAAFFTALICIILIGGIFHNHIATTGVRNKALTTMVSDHRYSSYSAVSDNIDKNTLLLLGSSEFRYSLNSVYHPRNLLKQNGINYISIGSGAYQSLIHALIAGSVGPKLTSRKIVLIVSPSWFRDPAIDAESYNASFSLLHYQHFMENPDISLSAKRYMSKRTHQLLVCETSKIRDIDRIDAVNKLKTSLNPANPMLYRFQASLLQDQDYMTLSMLLWKKEFFKEILPPHKQILSISDWNKVLKNARREERGKHKKQHFYMSNYIWPERRRPFIKSKNKYRTVNMLKSKEMDDFRLFLKICKAQNLDAKIIILPFNGYCYDYSGIPKTSREQFGHTIAKIAESYRYSYSDLTKYQYDKAFFVDAVHPSGYGWTVINKEIANFY